MTWSRRRLVPGALAVVALAAVSVGVFLMGGPGAERVRRLDARRVEDLVNISRAVDLYWTRHDRLPASLTELQREPGVQITSSDPVSESPYDYRPVGALAFEVCARFEGDSDDDRTTTDPFWSHGEGRQCFPREARKVP